MPLISFAFNALTSKNCTIQEIPVAGRVYQRLFACSKPYSHPEFLIAANTRSTALRGTDVPREIKWSEGSRALC